MVGLFYFWGMATTLTIIKAVKNRLPYLDNSIDDIINEFICEVQYRIQIYLSKTDLQVEDEAEYKVIEKSLIADITCCFLIMRKTVENIEGNISTGATGGGKYLKGAKAGEVGFEFALPTKNDITSFGLDTASILQGFKSSACQIAFQLGFSLTVCNGGSIEVGYLEGGADVPFIVYIP